MILLFFGCNSNEISLDIETIHIDAKSAKETTIGEACDSIIIIPLQGDNNFTGQFQKEKLLLTDDYIFVQYGRGIKQNINIYDWNGDLINTLDKTGKGPGEYIGIRSFDYDKNSNTLVVCNYTSKQLLFYSIPEFNFLKKIALDFNPDKFIYCNNEVLCIGKKNMSNLVAKFNGENFSELSIPNNEFTFKVASDLSIFTNQNDNLIYAFNDLSSILYKISNTICSPLFQINFGRQAVTDKKLYNNDSPSFMYEFMDEFTKSQCAGIVHNTMILDRKVCFNYVSGSIGPQGLCTAIYDKVSKTTVTYNKISIPGITQPIFPITTYKSFFVSLILPEQYSLNGEKINDKLGFAIREATQNIKQNSNDTTTPFIVLYRIK